MLIFYQLWVKHYVKESLQYIHNKLLDYVVDRNLGQHGISRYARYLYAKGDENGPYTGKVV